MSHGLIDSVQPNYYLDAGNILPCLWLLLIMNSTMYKKPRKQRTIILMLKWNATISIKNSSLL